MIGDALMLTEEEVKKQKEQVERVRQASIKRNGMIYAQLARAGVNVLSSDGDDRYIFEYSWKDPKQDGKLHWSKGVFCLDGLADWGDLVKAVEIARKELEE